VVISIPFVGYRLINGKACFLAMVLMLLLEAGTSLANSPTVDCVKPIFGNVTVTLATCKTGGGGNNDAKIVFTASGGDKYGISKGQVYAGIGYAAAHNLSSEVGDSLDILNASSWWTIRVFNGNNTCYRDKTGIVGL